MLLLVFSSRGDPAGQPTDSVCGDIGREQVCRRFHDFALAQVAQKHKES